MDKQTEIDGFLKAYIEDLKEYFHFNNMTLKRELKYWNNPIEAYNTELKECGDLDTFYRTTTGFLIANTEQYCLDRYDSFKKIITLLKIHNVKSVADYAGGNGFFSYLLAKEGFQVLYVDYKDSQTLDFNAFHFWNRGYNILVMDNELFMKRKSARYDAIIAIDIFEHLETPTIYLDQFMNQSPIIVEKSHFTEDQYNFHFTNKEFSIENYFIGNDYNQVYHDTNLNMWCKQ